MAIGERIYAREHGEVDKPESLTLGVVKENWNPLKPGMVKVLISTSCDGEIESDWMPVMSPYAGGGVGCYLLPEVGSTVVVGYIDDNSVSPIVLGCTWLKRGKKENDLPSGAATQKNEVKVFSFSNGALLRITENAQGDLLEVVTGRGQKVILNDKDQKMQFIAKQGGCSVSMDGKEGSLEVEVQKEIVLKVGGKEVVKLDSSGMSVDVNKATIKAQSYASNANQVKLEGASFEISAKGSLKVETSGVAQIKGSMLKLN